jgi:hypothetical protein
MPEKPVKLTAQQENFARVYVKFGNASRAYRAAYRVKDDTKPSSVWCNAAKMLANAKVRQRVEQLQAAAAERTVVNAVTIVGELEVARTAALELDMPSAAVSASMGKARVTGHLKAPESKINATVNSGIIVNVNVESEDAGLF